MADEAVTPERETVEVTDVSSASNALEGLLDLGDTPPRKPSAGNAEAQVEDANPEMAAAEASQLPDAEMEDKFIDFVMDESLDEEEQSYLMNTL